MDLSKQSGGVGFHLHFLRQASPDEFPCPFRAFVVKDHPFANPMYAIDAFVFDEESVLGNLSAVVLRFVPHKKFANRLPLLGIDTMKVKYQS